MLLFRQVTIIGLGLIGGSLGMALKKGKVARRVVGLARRTSTIREAKAKRAIDFGTTQLTKALDSSDLVILATPPKSVVPLATEIAACTSHRLILTDVASTKQQIVQSLEGRLPTRISFVGGHPMAGSERSGIEAARGDLFEGAVCMLTHTSRTSPTALSRVRALWKAVGSRIEVVSPGRHDEWVAEISHVPHMAAVGLMEATSSGALKMAGTGFSDATRIAQANPKLWEEISQTNRDQITRSLGRLIRELEKLRGLVKGQREKALLKKLRSAQKKRQALRIHG